MTAVVSPNDLARSERLPPLDFDELGSTELAEVSRVAASRPTKTHNRPIVNLFTAFLLATTLTCRALGQTTPLGITAGTTTELQLPDAATPTDTFWSTFPATASIGKDARVRLAIPATAPVGIGAYRVTTSAKVSSLRLLFIDDIPTTSRAPQNTSPKDAQSLTLPAAIESQSEPLTSHYYRFTAHAGQRIAFEVIARRVNSRIDPLVRLHDSAGRELAYCDDTPGLGADPRFAHTFSADGDYTIELRDANYEGGPDYRYRLRIGDFPTATVPFPLAARRGVATPVTFDGPTPADHLDPLKLKLDSPAIAQSIPLKLPGGHSSTFVTILTADSEDFVCSKPNHSPDAAPRVTLPINISGRITSPGVRDFYRVTAKKGDRLLLRARTRSVKSPAMLLLQVQKPDGTKVAQSKFAVAEPKTGDATPIPDEEGSLEVRIPADGDYDLVAQDLTGAAGPAAVYRLEVSKSDFDLTVDTEKLEAPAGAVAHLKVKANRHDFEAPITLTLTGDPATFGLKNATIPQGKSETDLEIQLPAKTPLKLLSFSVTGSTGDHTHLHTASTAPALRKLFPRLTNPPAQLDGLITLGILSPKKPTTQTTHPTPK